MFKLPWDNKSGGGKHRGNANKKYSSRAAGGSGFGRREQGPREMHKAVCDTCGKTCEIPFKPTSGKPIYCRDCFDRDGTPPKRNFKDFKSRENGRPIEQSRGNVDSDQLKKINDKLDKIIKLLESDEY